MRLLYSSLCLTLLLLGLPLVTRAQNSADTRDAESLVSLYTESVPLWFKDEQASSQAVAVLTALRNAEDAGLHAAEYQGAELTYRLLRLHTLAVDQQDTQRLQLDRDITTAIAKMIRHLHYGRIAPRRVGFDIQRTPDLDIDAVIKELTTTTNVPAVLQRIEPQFMHYRLLKAALNRYRLLAVDEELTQLPSFTTRSIKPGDTYDGAPALRRLLVAEQDLSAEQQAADSDLTLDAALVEALQRYQTRHGLAADGALGKQTFAALTTPFSKRAAQIELTLERWRWLPPLSAPMIVVNIPQFKLFAFQSNDDRETNLLRMNVIVGQTFEHTQTPVFLANMKYLVFRPYWDVPRDILNREMLADMQRDPSYLDKHQLELVNGQGDNSPVVAATPENIALLAQGELRVRQQPGASNALGEIKFMLPNAYNVYLHSTPAKHLFNETRRTFSHGCIRVSDPVALAEYVLRYAAGDWNTATIQAAMQGEANQHVNLQTSIPVLIMYGTVMPLESGVVQFFDDIYGHDAKLAKLL